MKANYLLIQQFNDSGVLRYYAAWLHFKRVFVNGCFYKSTNIPSRVGLSRNTTKKYIKFFLDNGWASYHGGNLRFTGKHHLKRSYGISLVHDVKLKRYGSVSEILNSLRYSILEVKFKQFKYIQRNYRDLVNPRNLKAYKSALKKDINFVPMQDESEQIALSYIKIANLIGVSKSKAVQLIKYFSDYIVKISGEIVCLGRSYGLSPEFILGNQFLHKGKLFTVKANKYEFL